MEIEKFGYAAAAYYAEDDKATGYFETSKGFLISHTVSIASNILRQSLLKPKTMPARFEKSDGQIKLTFNQGRGCTAEVIYKDISSEFNMERGSIFKRV